MLGNVPARPDQRRTTQVGTRDSAAPPHMHTHTYFYTLRCCSYGVGSGYNRLQMFRGS